MLKHVTDTLHRAPNPFQRVEKRFPRYVLITACTGAVSFIVALTLLHLGLTPLPALVLSVCVSGLANYTAMELWAFPHRTGRLAWSRLAANALAGGGAFAARYGVLGWGLAHLHAPHPFEKAVPLALAYLTSFAIGYLLRALIVFRK